MKRDGYKCVKCGTNFKETRLHIKHVIPLSEGGTNDIRNLHTLCEECYLTEKKEEEEERKQGDDQYIRIDSVR
ncbi:MAG: HNH endonuclease [archaeon]|nr:MAG: HNH endonuclease [archaeon]